MFTLFGLTGTWYGLVVGLSALCYLLVAGVLGYHKRLPTGTVRLYGLFGLPIALVLSRLLFCAVNFSYFSDSISQPWRMLAFWDGGYSLLGALCGLVLAVLITSRVQKVRFGTLLDVAVVPIGVLICGLRIAETLTGGHLGVGRQVDVGALSQLLPWLFLPDQMGTLTLYRLAVYRYEAAAALVILALSLGLFYGRHPRWKAKPGDLAMIVLSLFGASQIFLESMRDDGHMIMGFIRIQQLGYALIPLLALAILGARYAHIREVRKATVTAWLLLPVAALVVLLMVYPINHVLDLTGKRGIGFAALGAIAVYLAMFLRVRGANLRLILTWLMAIFAIAGCVMVEFSIDGSNNLVRDYTVMVACCALLFLAPFSIWRKLKSHVYREESITVHIDQSK